MLKEKSIDLLRMDSHEIHEKNHKQKRDNSSLISFFVSIQFNRSFCLICNSIKKIIIVLVKYRKTKLNGSQMNAWRSPRCSTRSHNSYGSNEKVQISESRVLLLVWCVPYNCPIISLRNTGDEKVINKYRCSIPF